MINPSTGNWLVKWPWFNAEEEIITQSAIHLSRSNCRGVLVWKLDHGWKIRSLPHSIRFKPNLLIRDKEFYTFRSSTKKKFSMEGRKKCRGNETPYWKRRGIKESRSTFSSQDMICPRRQITTIVLCMGNLCQGGLSPRRTFGERRDLAVATRAEKLPARTERNGKYLVIWKPWKHFTACIYFSVSPCASSFFFSF